jgi:hypothetical protein
MRCFLDRLLRIRAGRLVACELHGVVTLGAPDSLRFSCTGSGGDSDPRRGRADHHDRSQGGNRALSSPWARRDPTTGKLPVVRLSHANSRSTVRAPTEDMALLSR